MIHKRYTIGIQEISGFIKDFIGFKQSNGIPDTSYVITISRDLRDLKGSEEVSLNNFLLLYLDILGSGRGGVIIKPCTKYKHNHVIIFEESFVVEGSL